MHAITRWSSLLPLAFVLALAGCERHEVSMEGALPPVVRVAVLEPFEPGAWTTSGTVHAEIESPLAFRVSGQMLSREVSAGDRVRIDQRLMVLDPRDLREQLTQAQAELDRARSEADNAVVERERAERLVAQQLVSVEVFDRARTAADAALQRVVAAEAQLRQAHNAMDYAQLRSPADGVVLEILAEPGQVVGAGQAVARLAYDGAREIEVFIPHERRARVPERARAVIDGADLALEATLRELSAAADPLTRTWRARYRLHGAHVPELGSIVRMEFAGSAADAAAPTYRVPAAALSERGDGAQLWVVEGERVRPQPVEVLRLDAEHAYVITELPAGTRVVALGTHLLVAGQTVRIAAQ